MALEHWMTFATFSEQEFFTYPEPSTYAGVVLNANMVAHAPAGMAAFLLGKVSPTATYLIDPMTHAFQHKPETISNDKGPKSSIKKLAACYGGFILECLGSRPITPTLVSENIEEFSKKVIDFQWGHLEAHFLENGDAKYLEEHEKVRRPAIVVSPYFYLTEGGSDWLDVMTRAARISVQYAEGLFPRPEVFSALVIERALLQRPDMTQQLATAMSECGLDGVLLWVDEFDEISASTVELAGLARLCGSLRTAGLKVLNLHGGYFSCLLGSPAFGEKFSGVSHGPEFGESRAVVPVGGGIPISRFYVPDLHLRAKFRDFLSIALSKAWLTSAQKFHEEVCGCAECRRVIDGNVNNFSLYGESDVKSIKRKSGVVRIEFPTTEAKKRCLKHYLNQKVAEYALASNSQRPEILDSLERAHQKFYGVDSRVGSHLMKWRSVLGEL